MKRHAEAAADWDKAVELSPEPERPEGRLGRAASRVRAGQVEGAIQEAEELAKNANADTLYEAACVFALAADRPDPSGAALSKTQCARRAVALLQQAVAKGWTNAEHMKQDDDLKALRSATTSRGCWPNWKRNPDRGAFAAGAHAMTQVLETEKRVRPPPTLRFPGTGSAWSDRVLLGLWCREAQMEKK